MESSSTPSFSSIDRVNIRTRVLAGHFRCPPDDRTNLLVTSACLNYSPPELSERFDFDTSEFRKLMDGHNMQDRDWLFGLMMQSKLFCPRERGGRVFVSPDYNQTMEQQREATMKRIDYLLEKGVFEGWLTGKGPENELRKLALMEVLSMYDHSLAIKVGVHFFLWGGAVQFFGTKSHHDKWLRDTEKYFLKGCFSMTELGHGSNVRGIETVATYDSKANEFVINTPCESAQKYWIGGAANHATHTIVFSHLLINGKDEGVHAFIVEIRDANGNVCPNIRIADCGHKIGLNGVDNGRIWFDHIRVPGENLLNSVADVSSDGQYLSAISDPDQRFGAFMAPLTSGRITIAGSAVYISKIALAIAIRYSLSRRAFSITPNGREVLLLDYPSHQRRLLPLLAKTCVMSFAANHLKMMYVMRTPESNKAIHVISSAFKATLTWNNMRTLQECREACGGQGLKTENLVGHLKGEYDVQSTFEGDNNVLMQQIGKALFAEYVAAKKNKRPFRGLGLEHMNRSPPAIPRQLTSSILRSAQFQIDIFLLREQDLLERFAAAVSEHLARGETKEYAFIMTYELAEELGKAFSERAILDSFVAAQAKVSDGLLKKLLDVLRSTYTLICLEEDSVFLRYGYLTVEQASVVRKEVGKLCGDIRPHALGIVSSFGIPDAFLAPIAYNWVEANSWPLQNH